MTELKLEQLFAANYAASGVLIPSIEPEMPWIPTRPWMEVAIRRSESVWSARFGTEDGTSTARLMTAITATPDPEVVCVVASGSAYAVDTRDSLGLHWKALQPYSIRFALGDKDRELLVLIGDIFVAAYGQSKDGGEILACIWETAGIGDGDIRAEGLSGRFLHVTARTGRPQLHVSYRVDLDSGDVALVDAERSS